MNGMKCQLCDGFIVNGRCKICGMPYRNDEVLYHLNESRKDHYKHATPKAKEMMRQSRIPLGDKKTSYNRNDQTGSGQTRASAAQRSDRLMSKEEIRVKQEQVRREAMAKINSTKVPNRNVNANKKTKKKGFGWIWWVFVIFYLIVGAILR